MAKPHILIVEDDEDIQQLVSYNLLKAGFNVTCAENGNQSLELFETETPDLVILDLMLPGINGLEVCRTIRQNPAQWETPIIMLTAKGEEEDIVKGLEYGADDYMTKPFSPKVLIARIKAQLRRKKEKEKEEVPKEREIIEIHGLNINPIRHEVTIQGKAVDLTLTEFNILKFIATRPGWVFSRQQIIDEVRGYDFLVTTRAVDVQIFGLRKKLGDAGELIETVRGIGYRFKE